MDPNDVPSTDFRREGRELALKLLYREKLTGLTDRALPEIERAGEEALSFAEEIVSGVRENLPAIDSAISRASEHWDIGRMGVVDLSVLRIGVFELLYRRDTPVPVVINEAVEIARRFSSSECGRFVNGVLDHIARETRNERSEED